MKNRNFFWLTIAAVLCVGAVDRWPTATAFMELRRQCATAFAHAAEVNAYDEKTCRKICDADANTNAAIDCEHGCVAPYKYADAEDRYVQRVCTDGDDAEYGAARLIRSSHHDTWLADMAALRPSR